MPNRAQDWLHQALVDIEVAEDIRRSHRHEWACFAAHQAAEKAVKALHLQLGQEAWGHVVARLPGRCRARRRSGMPVRSLRSSVFKWPAMEFDTRALPVPADVFVYTMEEWRAMQREGRRFYRTVEDEAVWVYRRDNPRGGGA